MSSGSTPAEDPEGRLRRVHPLSPLLRGGIVAVAIVVAAGRQLLEGGSVDWPLPVVGAVVAAVVGWGAVSWWAMRFRLGAETLRIESGVLLRRSRRIRLDRVQAVEVQQPLLARLLGMAELAIETAGSGTEATLAYLRLAEAHRLRAELLERSALAAGVPAAERADPDAAGGLVPPEPPPDVLHRVPPGRLLLSQLVRTAPLVTLAVTTALIAAAVALGEPLGVTFVVPAGIALLGTVGTAFLAQYGFELTRTRRGLGVRAGLLDVRSQSIPVDRVQGVVVLEPLVWRWIGWCEVQVTVAGVRQRADDGGHLAATLLPVIARGDGERIAVEALGGRDPRGAALRPGPRAARRLDPVGWRTQALGVADDMVVARRGVLVRRTDLVPRHKIQSCALRQGPLQRRLGLATVHVHLPPGPVDAEARHRESAQAWQLALSLAGRAV